MDLAVKMGISVRERKSLKEHYLRGLFSPLSSDMPCSDLSFSGCKINSENRFCSSSYSPGILSLPSSA